MKNFFNSIFKTTPEQNASINKIKNEIRQGYFADLNDLKTRPLRKNFAECVLPKPIAIPPSIVGQTLNSTQTLATLHDAVRHQQSYATLITVAAKEFSEPNLETWRKHLPPDVPNIKVIIGSNHSFINPLVTRSLQRKFPTDIASNRILFIEHHGSDAVKEFFNVKNSLVGNVAIADRSGHCVFLGEGRLGDDEIPQLSQFLSKLKI